MNNVLASPMRSLILGLLIVVAILAIWIALSGVDSIGFTSFLLRAVHIVAAMIWVGMIWFVNENATTSGDGRLSSPFDTLSAFNAVNNGTGNNPAAGDNIFLYESSTNYTGPVTLLDNQRLIGQDARDSLATITGLSRPSGSAPFPTMSTVNAPRIFSTLKSKRQKTNS